MFPSHRSGRGRRAPSCLQSLSVAYLLIAAVACTAGKTGRPEAGHRASPVQEHAKAAPAAPAEQKEGGTGTRAKGEEATRRYAAADRQPLAPPATAPSPGIARAPSAAAGSGYGMSGLGLSGSAGHGRVSRQMKGISAHSSAVADRVHGARPPFDTEAYAHVSENPFLSVKDQPLSTFSSDVDTASFSNARRFLDSERLPPKDSIRVEEWMNYFAYEYPAPTGEAPVAVATEVSSCPWAPDHRLVRVGVKTRPIAQQQTPARNLVFLIDVSGSMASPDKLPLLKGALGLLAKNLRAEDSIAMVVYAGASGLVLPPTSGARQDRILDALEALDAGGSTNGGDGIRLAYSVASQAMKRGGINRVVLATDGDFNVGTTSDGELTRLIEDKRKSGVFLTVLGFGQGNLKDSTMEMLADKGNGNYAYIDSLSEAKKVLVHEAGATLVTVAKDVKLQVEMNPARVASYRLIGYENRLLAKEDFNDDKKDAGDMGAGHAVTALYEVVPVGVKAPSSTKPAVDPLKYQAPGALSAASSDGELMTVAVRYKAPGSDTSKRIAHVVKDASVPFAQASTDHRFATAVAHFALVLRGARGFEAETLQTSRRLVESALDARAGEDRRALPKLIAQAERLRSSGGVIAN